MKSEKTSEDEIKKAIADQEDSQEAIKAIKEMSDHILNSVKQAINTMGEYWNQNKEKILVPFSREGHVTDEVRYRTSDTRKETKG